MQRSVDKFVSIFGMTDHAAAFAVDACEVHILIDLNGHSKGARYRHIPSISVMIHVHALEAQNAYINQWPVATCMHANTTVSACTCHNT